jgi:hypothetical protein
MIIPTVTFVLDNEGNELRVEVRGSEGKTRFVFTNCYGQTTTFNMEQRDTVDLAQWLTLRNAVTARDE